jgi:hypothetical protein
MNKTVNINLGGMFFHIDEDAYQKLTRYFEAIKRSLSSANVENPVKLTTTFQCKLTTISGAN